MITVAIYTRKSKASEKGESIETQKKLCLDHIQKIYFDQEVKTLFYDEGEGKSGGDSKRIKFQKLMKDARKKSYDVLMCYRLDRVARSVGDFADLIEELTPNKINFISVKEQFDTGTPMGRAMMYTASVFAQLEREIGAERVKDNLHELAKTGQWLGGITPTGYGSEGYSVVKIKEVNENNEVEIKKKKVFKLKKVEEEGKILEILYKKLEDLHTLTAVETYLFNNDIFTRNGKIFTRHTIQNIYTNIVYAKNDMDMYEYLTNKGVTIYANKEDFDGTKGMIAYNKTLQQKHKAAIKNDMQDWIIAIGKHEGYISGKRWINLQNILQNNKQKAYRRPRKNKALLSGILRCECSDYMRPKIKSGVTDRYGEDRFFYMCKTKEMSRKQKCDINNIDGNELDRKFLNQMKLWFAPNSKIVKELKNIANYKEEESDDELEIERLKKQFKKNEKEMNSLINRIKYVDIELIDEINKEIKRLKEENIKINNKLQSLGNKNKKYQLDMPESEIAKLVLEVIENFFDAFPKMDILKQREILKMFISSAVWDGEKVTIDLLNTDSDEIILTQSVPECVNRQ